MQELLSIPPPPTTERAQRGGKLLFDQNVRHFLRRLYSNLEPFSSLRLLSFVEEDLWTEQICCRELIVFARFSLLIKTEEKERNAGENPFA